jgi:GR25 family glycosyltransferase involved in LPS biosynthesis
MNQQIFNIEDIKNILYINLDERTDRKEHVLKQLNNIGIDSTLIKRFSAIKMTNGAIGCSLSHLKCIQIAKEQKWSHVFICEDDILFGDIQLFKNQFSTFMKLHHYNWDVLLFAGNNMYPYTQIDDTCIQVYHCLTTTGYFVKQEYYDTLIQNFKEGIQLFLKHPHEKQQYAIDKYWIKLQQKHCWFLIIPTTVYQIENYSDIEKKNTNFKNYMLNYQKAFYPFQKII